MNRRDESTGGETEDDSRGEVMISKTLTQFEIRLEDGPEGEWE